MQDDEDETNLPNDAVLMLDATFKLWDFLEESGFELNELVGKEVSFIVKTPDGGGRRLGIHKLMQEIDEASSAGKACELCLLQVVVSNATDSAESSPWENAEFPVSRLRPRAPERAEPCSKPPKRGKTRNS